MGNLLKRLHYGELVLWMGFVGLSIISLDNPPENAVAIAGLFALAAIGLRATRATTSAASAADGE